MKRPHLLIGIAVLIIVVVLGGWYAFSNPQIASALGFRHAPQHGGPNSMGSTTPMRGGMAGGFVTGSIEVLNDSGFTVTLQDGTTKDVTLTATTTIQDFATASSTPTTISLNQLSVGEQVFVIGMPAADGSVAARRIEAGTFPAGGPGMGQFPGGKGGAGGMMSHGARTGSSTWPKASH